MAEYLSIGHTEGRSTAAGPMGLVLNNSLRFLTQDDILAMVAYLKTIPPMHDQADLAVAQKRVSTTPSEARTRSPDGAGALMMISACVYLKAPAHAAIIGTAAGSTRPMLISPAIGRSTIRQGSI